MEKELLKRIKVGLLEEKEKLEKELGEIAKKRGKKFVPIYPEYGNKDEENAAEIAEYEIHLALDKNLEGLLTKTIRALAKIEAGTYGHCDNCGKEIAPERLEAFPSAGLCITCQAKKENPIIKFFNRIKPHKRIKQPQEKIKKRFGRKLKKQKT